MEFIRARVTANQTLAPRNREHLPPVSWLQSFSLEFVNYNNNTAFLLEISFLLQSFFVT